MTKEQANVFSYIFTGMSLKDFTTKMLDDIRDSDNTIKKNAESINSQVKGETHV